MLVSFVYDNGLYDWHTHSDLPKQACILDPSLPTRQWTCQELSPSLLQKSDSDLTASKGRRKYLDFIDTLLEAKVPLCVCVCVCALSV